MRKLLFSVAFVATNFAFGQITLEHSYTSNNDGYGVYNDNATTNYIICRDQKTFDIYGANHNFIKSFTPNIPTGYVYDGPLMEVDYTVSKHIFNTDDKLEFILFFYNSSLSQSVTIIVNEDGNIIKQFGNEYNSHFHIFHDTPSNSNKFVITKNASSNRVTEVYSLPTSSLTTKEIQTKAKLSAFPVPANKILNVINPQNDANRIEIFDTTGKLVVNKSFGASENKIAVDVENLPNGNYIYRIGDLSSRFIKN